MALALVSVVGGFTLVVVVLIAWYSQTTQRDRIVASHELQKVVVTLKSGETFDGLVRDADGHTLVLVKASSLAPGRDPIPVDGSLYVARADIAYLQRP